MTFLKIDMRNPVLVCGLMKFLFIKLTNIRNRTVLVIYAKKITELAGDGRILITQDQAC